MFLAGKCNCPIPTKSRTISPRCLFHHSKLFVKASYLTGGLRNSHRRDTSEENACGWLAASGPIGMQW